MPRFFRSYWFWALALLVVGVTSVLGYRDYTSLYDASYVGSARCGECHTQVHEDWHSSPHANMVRLPSKETVVGDFDDHLWTMPESQRETPRDAEPIARMRREGDDYFMDLRHPDTWEWMPFKIDYVIGYQYRQAYVFKEPTGVIRRLPLQWSTESRSYFAYWNFQEKSKPSARDFWAQLERVPGASAPNGQWNMFCARCHTTKLEHEFERNERGQLVPVKSKWVEKGIGCESCHGPGSHHVDYFETNCINRIAAFLNSKIRGEPVAYIVNPRKLTKGQEVSVCARCHGPDIQMETTEVYRNYEPGYSEEGRINDLTKHLKEVPLTPGRKKFTVETWDDGRPKGIAMVLRSFIESKCWNEARVSCYDCHDPHANKLSTEPGMLVAGGASDRYCMKCHESIGRDIAGHTKHEPNTAGSHCYDCHMPKILQNVVTGVEKWSRTHWMSTIPSPESSVRFGKAGAKNACNDCHEDKSPEWAVEWKRRWWGK